MACPSDPGYSAALTLTAWLLQIARILCTDTPQSIYYTAMLLRRYHSYLTAMEQALLLARVEQLTAQLAIAANDVGSQMIEGSLDGLPAVTNMEYCRYAV